MKKTDHFKGRIFQLLDRARSRRYVASFDITAHTNLLNGTSIHLAFAKDSDERLIVSVMNAGKPPFITHFTRTANELIEGNSEGKYCLEVYPDQVLRFLRKIGLSKTEFQNLVEEARYELNSN